MKRFSGFFMAIAVIVFALVMAGCSKKEEPATSVAKPAQGTLNMEEGQWEITTSFEMRGMPAGMAKPHTATVCLSKQDYVPKSTEQTDCTMQDTKVDGNTVSWSVVCRDSTSKGRVTYAGSTFDGLIETTTKDGGKDMTSRMTMNGKHLGPCPK
ncbi:MAG: DUF3617 family protein [Thermodesulfovibrionales bacterium]|nr:DUF3617 family protein [Thermodesulfovibrionales bacterium]